MNGPTTDAQTKALEFVSQAMSLTCKFPASREILQGILHFLPVFRIFEAEFASDFGALQQNSLRNGAGNFCKPSRDFIRVSRELQGICAATQRIVQRSQSCRRWSGRFDRSSL